MTRAEQILIDIARVVRPRENEDAFDRSVMVSLIRCILETEQDVILELLADVPTGGGGQKEEAGRPEKCTPSGAAEGQEGGLSH